MRRFLIVPLLALALSGCAALSAVTGPPVNNPLTARGVYELRAGYDAAFLIPATNYARLPLCLTGHKFTAAVPCAQRSVVARLQKADQAVQGALDRLQRFTLANPTLGADAYMTAAQDAIIEAESLISLLR
jgi:hypothetical protein